MLYVPFLFLGVSIHDTFDPPTLLYVFAEILYGGHTGRNIPSASAEHPPVSV